MFFCLRGCSCKIEMKSKFGFYLRGSMSNLVFWFLFMTSFLIHTRQAISVPSNTDSSNVCLTPGCAEAASHIRKNLDESVEPCDDFYQFSCGGWLNTRTINKDMQYLDVFYEVYDDINTKLRGLLEKKVSGSEPEFVRMIKQIYTSCMDLTKIEDAGSEPLLKSLKSLGGWPVVEGDNWDGPKFDWLDTLIHFRKLGFSQNILLRHSVISDESNDAVRVIQLDRPSLGMPDIGNPIEDLSDSPSTTAYFNLMVKAAKKLGANEETAEEELMKALKFEISLAKLSLPREEGGDISKLNVQQLQELFPKINWLKYFNGLLDDPIFVSESLIVYVPDFIKEFAELIKSTDKKVVANYMMWRAALQTFSLLSKDWRDLAQEYHTLTQDERQEVPRWEQCLSLVSDRMGIALGSYYVRNYFKDDSKEWALELVKYIHKEFLTILDNNDWMDDGMKTEAKQKANAIKSYIGYPDELLNDAAVMEPYENLMITDGSYFDNIMNLRKWSTDHEFNQLLKPSIREDWKNHAEAHFVNGFYIITTNSIEFSAGILQSPYFNKDQPYFMNFGAIGFFIGHEISHGFDDNGLQYDKDGNLVDWWSSSTAESFNAKAQCFIEQYSNYTAENGMKVNGTNTRVENIADNGALKIAYRAYQSWVEVHGEEKKLPDLLKYTPNQLFWISAASALCGKYEPELLNSLMSTATMCPPHISVKGSMSNLPEFSNDFHCAPDSAMNRENKCQMW